MQVYILDATHASASNDKKTNKFICKFLCFCVLHLQDAHQDALQDALKKIISFSNVYDLFLFAFSLRLYSVS